MKNGLESAYELVVENEKKGTVKSSLKPGSAAAGDMKKADGGMGPENAGIKKPAEGDTKINPGHGKIKTESSQKELSSMLPTSKFDSLFKKQVIEEEDNLEGDASPLEMGGEGEFDDEEGDFPPEGGDETAEEVDVATELRMIIDRLSEIAERLGAFDDDMEEAGDDVGEADAENAEPELAPESVQKGGPGKGAADGKMKPFPDTSKKFQGPKSCNCVKSAFKVSSKKAATGQGGPGKGAADGKLGPARKTDLGPKMSMKANVKGTMGKPGAGIFDSI